MSERTCQDLTDVDKIKIVGASAPLGPHRLPHSTSPQ